MVYYYLFYYYYIISRMNKVENFDNFDIANQWGQFIDIDHHAPIFTKNKVNIPYTIMENDSVRNYSSESTPLSPPISQYIIHNPTNNNTTILIIIAVKQIMHEAAARRTRSRNK